MKQNCVPFLRLQWFFSHEQSQNLNKKLSQHSAEIRKDGKREIEYCKTQLPRYTRDRSASPGILLLLYGFRRRDSRKAVVEICSLNYERRTREMETDLWSPFLSFWTLLVLLSPLILVISVSIPRSTSNSPNVINLQRII